MEFLYLAGLPFLPDTLIEVDTPAFKKVPATSASSKKWGELRQFILFLEMLCLKNFMNDMSILTHLFKSWKRLNILSWVMLVPIVFRLWLWWLLFLMSILCALFLFVFCTPPRSLSTVSCHYKHEDSLRTGVMCGFQYRTFICSYKVPWDTTHKKWLWIK